jgi:hypothetical protein
MNLFDMRTDWMSQKEEKINQMFVMFKVSSVHIAGSAVPHCVPFPKWRHCCLFTKNKYK